MSLGETVAVTWGYAQAEFLPDRFPDNPLPLAQADSVRLERVLDNQLSSAIEDNRPGSWVHVRAWAEPARGPLIQAADNGLGLCAEQPAELFQPVNRLAPASNRALASAW
ncbi:hypothetical protein OOZ63_04105 [Paucibacter sp. PLA-PC-4]|uniref:hypothetical protein n=1 Tax=Paucibacter sp. PLA-PC-4 TaxID=2993655 RepID=UPI00224933C9|nr:hypothetical protein [Paucibacter sp. PLA-PC-4]MCX2861017.1 hypothetical protein [Paucibacter sp. PLA-PC-4]